MKNQKPKCDLGEWGHSTDFYKISVYLWNDDLVELLCTECGEKQIVDATFE